MYRPDVLFPVYCSSCWWSDKWDALSYGQDYDFQKPFSDQLRDLLNKVPRNMLVIRQSVNSDYCNYSNENKNCYLCFASHYNEDCAYLTYCYANRNCFDSLQLSKSELSYECNYCDRIARSLFLQYCVECVDCVLGYNLRNCDNCFGCVNLRNKKYHIFNKPYSKEKYLLLTEQYRSSYQEFWKACQEFQKLKMSMPHPFIYQKRCVNYSGNDLEDSKNVQHSFGTKESEDCRYLYINCVRVRSSMDLNNIGYAPSEWCYEGQGISGGNNVFFSDGCWMDGYIMYSHGCFSSSNIFGCVSVRQKEYCILNKQYSQEEYKAILTKIIKHMKSTREYGEFLPSELSPFAYNETTAQEYFPLTKEQALIRHCTWRDPETKNYQITLPAGGLPITVNDISSSLTNEVIACEHGGSCKDQCTVGFRLTPSEITFYKRMKILVPRLCPNCRHAERRRQRNPMKLWPRQCMCDYKIYQNTIKHPHHSEGKCPNEFETSYAPDRPEIVYCEQCYNAEVV